MNGERICPNENMETILTNEHYSNAMFCNGQSSEIGTACDAVNGYSVEAPGKPVNTAQVFYCTNECGQLYDFPPTCSAE